MVGKKGKQLNFQNFKSYHQFNYGGILRRKRAGRGRRPLSTKEPLHMVFKINKAVLRTKSLRSIQTFSVVERIIKTYAKRFFLKIEQVTIQHDHCHLLVRAPRRSQFHFFFRVVAGQIAQIFLNEGLLITVTDTPKLWLFRPFSRVVRGWKAYKIARDYIQLNQKEVTGQIMYSSKRLKGLSTSDWSILWR